MHKVIVCDHGFEGSRMEHSGTQRDRDHNNSIRNPLHEESNLENGFKELRAQSTCLLRISQQTPSPYRVFQCKKAITN